MFVRTSRRCSMICSSDCWNYRFGFHVWLGFDASRRLVGIVLVVCYRDVVRLTLSKTHNLMPKSFPMPSWFVFKHLQMSHWLHGKENGSVQLTPWAGVSSLLEVASSSLSSAGCSSLASGAAAGSEWKRQREAKVIDTQTWSWFIFLKRLLWTKTFRLFFGIFNCQKREKS